MSRSTIPSGRRSARKSSALSTNCLIWTSNSEVESRRPTSHRASQSPGAETRDPQAGNHRRGHPPRSAPYDVGHPPRRNRSRAGQEGPGRSQPSPGRFGGQKVRQSRPAPAGPDPGRQHRPDARRRQIRIPPRLQVFDLRHVVDSPGHHARHRRPVAHHPHSRSHERVHEQVPARDARAGKRTRPRADQRRNLAAAWTFRSRRSRS